MSRDQINETKEIENALEEIYQSPAPSAEFLDTLENQLKQAHRQTLPAPAQQSPRPRRSFRWAAAPAFIVLAIMLLVAVVGPKNVLAQVQALIGYVPGVGFVDVNDIRILVSTVSQTQDGVTVTVKQVMMGPEETYLVLGVDGLEPPEKLLEDYWPQTPEQSLQEWQERYQALWESDGRLILPDGTEIYGSNYQGAPWDGYYTMPSLPADVLSATFTVTRLPGVPADKAPQGWTFDLQFGYADTTPAGPEVGSSNYTADSTPAIGETDSSAPSVSLPEASPVDTGSEAFQGISLRVADVVYANTETTIRLKIENIPLDWHYRRIDFYGTLIDDLDNQYNSIYGPVYGLQPDGTYILSFEPVSPEASSLILSVDQITVVLMVEGKTISVDFGDQPQVGDSIPMDSTIEILGIPLHFNAVNIRAEDVAYTPEDIEAITWFDFILDPVKPKENLAVSGIMFTGEALQALGANNGVMGGGGGGGGSEEAESTYYFFPSIGIPADLDMPTGSYQLPIGEAQISILGPFVISWEMPAQ